MVGFDMSAMRFGLIPLLLLVFWIIPIIAGIWALVTLQRIRSGQELIRFRLEMLERTLQRGAGQ